jgi:hypothetical protein
VTPDGKSVAKAPEEPDTPAKRRSKTAGSLYKATVSHSPKPRRRNVGFFRDWSGTSEEFEGDGTLTRELPGRAEQQLYALFAGSRLCVNAGGFL